MWLDPKFRTGILGGQEPVCEEFISSIVDHPAYKEMVREQGMLKAKGVPLHIRAIDAPPSIQDRDGTMLSNILYGVKIKLGARNLLK